MTRGFGVPARAACAAAALALATGGCADDPLSPHGHGPSRQTPWPT